MTADIREHGGEVRLNAPVTQLRSSDHGRVTRGVAGGETLTPVARDLVAAAAHDRRHRRARGAEPTCATPRSGLRYREFLTVLLVIEG